MAVYHNDLRAELLQEAAKGGKYDHERTEGEGTTDITSFLASQKSWGSKRGNWPDVLFQVEMVKNNNLPKTVPLWYRDKKLLIDHDNRPMRDFSELLPATLSSEAEGWLMEAFLRSDRRVQMRDLRGRMPKDIIVADKTGTGNGQTTKPLFTMRTITQRTLRFRGLAGLKARDIRGGSDAINRGIEALLPAEALKKNNSKDLGRILTNAEVKAITKPNAGKYPQRGRGDKKALNAYHASAVTTKTKRKRTSDLAENGEDTTMANVKRARHEGGSGNAAFLEIRPVVTQGSGIGLPTPELSSTAELTPDDLYRNLSPPDHLNSSYPDSELFEPNPLLSDGELFQGPAKFSIALKGVNRLDDLMSVDPHQAYRILNQDSSNRRWGVKNHVNQPYGNSAYGQPYYPGVPPYGNQGAPIGGNLSHQWGLSDYPMHAPFYQTPVATAGNHHGHSLGASWDPIARSSIEIGHGQTHRTSAALYTSTDGYNVEWYDVEGHNVEAHNMEETASQEAPTSTRSVYSQGPIASMTQTDGYGQLHHTSMADHVPTDHHNMEGNSSPELGASTGPMYNQVPIASMTQNDMYGQIHYASMANHASIHPHNMEENSYQGSVASARPLHSQAPVAPMTHTHADNAGRNIVDDTVLRTESLPPRTQSDADRAGQGRKRKAQVQKHKNKSPAKHSTARPAARFPMGQNEEQLATLDDPPSVSMPPNTTSRVVYTTLDGTPVYYSSVPYDSGSNFEQVDQLQGEGAGADTSDPTEVNRQSKFTLPKSGRSANSALEEYLLEDWL